MASTTVATPTPPPRPISLGELASCRKRKAGEASAPPANNSRPKPTTKASKKRQKHAAVPSAANATSDGIFATPPPPAQSPWSLSFPAPRPTYPFEIACPIDWARISRINAEQIQAYELRSPWNPEQKAFKEVRAELAKAGVKIVEEACRKRFKKANELVFEATGVYFENSPAGLEKWGVPSLKNFPKTAPVVSKAGPSKKRNGRGPAAKVYEKPKYYGKTILLELKGGDGGFTHRRADADLVRKTCDRSIDNGDALPFTPDAFNHWYSFFALGLRHDFPKRIYLLEKTPDGQANYSDAAPLRTIRNYFETYCLSQYMETPNISDAILDALLLVLKEEKTLPQKYVSGELDWNDKVEVLRFLDFEPDDLNLLWENTAIEDPARVLLLDILSFKGDEADSKIKEAEDQYHPEFLRLWKERLAVPLRQKFQPTLTRLQQLNEQVSSTLEWTQHDAPQLEALNQELFSLVFHLQPLHNLENHISDLSNKASELEPRILTYGNYHSDDEFDDYDEHDWDDHYASRSNIAELLTGADVAQAFCEKYHNHDNDTPCYKTQPVTFSGPPDNVTPRASTPEHYVQMRIDGVDGFTIQNHTNGYLNKQQFQDLPKKFPIWDWDRIRSINCHTQYASNTKNDGITQYFLQRHKSKLLIHPVYYDDRTADSAGRYPSHPGYRNSSWVQLEPSTADSYIKPWYRARRRHIPEHAVHPRNDSKTGELLFNVKDPDWYPSDMYYRSQWNAMSTFEQELIKEQNELEVPMMVVKAWRPWEHVDRDAEYQPPF